MHRPIFAAICLAVLIFATLARAETGVSANADDTARFLAGMPVSNGSTLESLTQSDSFREHAGRFDSLFGKLEQQQLGKIRVWSRTHLKSPRPTVFYFFGGPDFLYANAFFPNASTYVLGGLEAVGRIPDLTTLPEDTLAHTLNKMRRALSTIFYASYFVTDRLDTDLNMGPVHGILPVLYVFLARSGKSIFEVSLVHLDSEGKLYSGSGAGVYGAVPGAKIIFGSDNGRRKSLYYFSANVDDNSISRESFLKFCNRQGQGDSFLKSASSLLHESKFSRVRSFILENSALILQDDSGIPIRYFQAGKWSLHPFGIYARPLNIFKKYYQREMVALYQRNSRPIDFGFGYHAQYNKSNLLLAVRNGKK